MESNPFLAPLPRLRSILLVDDDSDSAFLLKRELVRSFPQAEIRDVPSTAVLALIALAPPDLLISTYRLQKITGLEFIGQIRETGGRFPIAIISSMSVYRSAALSAGADLFLAYEDAKQLPEQLRELFEKRRNEYIPTAANVSNLPDKRDQRPSALAKGHPLAEDV